jgi:hypothetical protein
MGYVPGAAMEVEMMRGAQIEASCPSCSDRVTTHSGSDDT